jgi:hypothetical protein
MAELTAAFPREPRARTFVVRARNEARRIARQARSTLRKVRSR